MKYAFLLMISLASFHSGAASAESLSQRIDQLYSEKSQALQSLGDSAAQNYTYRIRMKFRTDYAAHSNLVKKKGK